VEEKAWSITKEGEWGPGAGGVAEFAIGTGSFLKEKKKEDSLTPIERGGGRSYGNRAASVPAVSKGTGAVLSLWARKRVRAFANEGGEREG